MADDPFDLQRFVDAQDPVYASVLGELAARRKTGHWMWFVFPQLKGLGRSSTAQTFAIAGRMEARAYAAHPVLWPRLLECAGYVLAANVEAIDHLLPFPDDLKLRSCMTLFDGVQSDARVFASVLERYFDGERDQATLDLLDR